MNSKAQRQSIEWPPLLNLSKDRPHVDPSFKNAEKVNVPYLNSMLQPLWKKSTGRKSTYDQYGNEYYLEDGQLKGDLIPNGKDIADYRLSKRELDFSAIDGEVIAYEPDHDMLLYLSRTSQRPTFVSAIMEDGKYVGANLTSTLTQIPEGAVVIESRVKWLESSSIGIIVIYYDYNDLEYVYIGRFGTDQFIGSSYVAQATWYKQSIMFGAVPSFATSTTMNLDPIIHIADHSSSYAYVSFTSYTGEVIPGPHAWFMTFRVPTSTAAVTQITTFGCNTGSVPVLHNSTDKVKVTFTKTSKTSVRTVVSRDYTNYYIYNSNATDLEQLTKCYDIPTNYSFSQRRMTQTLKEGNNSYTYNVYQFSETIVTYTWKVVGTPGLYYALRIPAYLYNGNYDANGWQYPLAIEGSAIESASGTDPINIIVKTPSTTQKTLGSATVGFTYKYYQGQAEPTVTNGSMLVYCGSAPNTSLYDRNVQPYDRGNYVEFAYGNNDSTESVSVSSWNGVPCVVLDDGNFYMFADFNYPTSWSAQGSSIWTSNSSKMALKGTLFTSTTNNITTSPQRLIGLDGYTCLRGLSYVIDQNFIGITVKACGVSSASPQTLISDKESGASVFIEAFYSNATDEVRYLPGTVRKSDWSYYSYSLTGNPSILGPSEDLLTFTPGGFRVSVPGTNFKLLYNTYTSNYSYMQGISWASSDSMMGTLVTPWQSVNNHYYVSGGSYSVVYRNKDNIWIELYVEEGAELFTVLEDRLVVANTTSYINCFDSKAKRFFHYATDYNGRVMHGITTPHSFRGTIATASSEYSAYPYMRYTADAINPLYSVMPRDVISSMILPVVARYRCYVNNEKAYGCSVPEPDLGIDLFWSDFTSTQCIYRMTWIGATKEVKHELQGLLYPGSISTSPSLTPNMFTKYVNGAGNNDVVVEDYDAYTLTYYDNNPHLLYSSTTQVSNLYNDRNVFFVLQGQFYGVIGDKLYSLAYSQGAIAGMDAIIDLGDLQFIGNNPMISFWYDPATRVIRSFTGDANLEFLYSATKIKEYYQSWYDETSQSIFAATDAGLLVFGSRNTYLLEDYKDVSSVQFSNDGVTHITNNGITDNIRYYKEDGYEAIPLDFETSFYGLGATESTTIDRWNVTLYDLEGDHPESYVTVGVRSLTDITVKSEEKTFKITPDMYDKWSNSVLISYSPKLIKGQGIRLYVKTPLTLQSVVPHIMDNKTGTTTRREL